MTDAAAGHAKPAPRTGLVLAALGALILLKAVLLVFIGPLTSPDTSGYAAIADAMRSGVYWGALDLTGPNAATLISRAPGYPALLALSGCVAGASAFWIVAIVQIGLGLLAAIALYEFAFLLLGSAVAALLVAAAYATGLPLVLDQTMLTDGAYASLLVIFMCLLGRFAIGGSRISYRIVFLIGVLPAMGMLLRESTTQVMVVLLPVLACFAFAARTRWLPRLAVLVVLVLPLMITSAGVSGFNAWRTGAAFVTSGLRSALLVPLVQMQARGAPVFETDDPVVRVLKEEIGVWRNEAIYAGVTRAEQRLGLTPVAMSEKVRTIFLRSVATYPGVYAGLVLSELRPRYFAISVVPAASLGTLLASRAGALVSVSQSVPEHGIARTASLAVYGGNALIAGFCWLAMVAGLPVLAALRLRRGAGVGFDLILLLALAASHLGLLLLYALVHIEARYLVPVQFVPPLAAAYLAMAWLRGRCAGAPVPGQKREPGTRPG